VGQSPLRRNVPARQGFGPITAPPRSDSEREAPAPAGPLAGTAVQNCLLGVNTNTVLRALRQLRDEGLLEFRRGRGITVTGTAQRGAVGARARDLVLYARRCGYRLDELLPAQVKRPSRRIATGGGIWYGNLFNPPQSSSCSEGAT
jgi:hypothetical protein